MLSRQRPVGHVPATVGYVLVNLNISDKMRKRTRNESVPIPLARTAQCWFPGLAISVLKYKYIFQTKVETILSATYCHRQHSNAVAS